MKRRTSICIALVFSAHGATQSSAIAQAASRFLPGVAWHADSAANGDFTCDGHKQTAILGTSGSEVVVAVFLAGVNRKPEELRFRIFDPKSAELTTEDLDYQPDYELPGFQQSKTCMGLNVDDHEVDPAHLYWDHKSHRFGMWRV
jgi:hypothetical protein